MWRHIATFGNFLSLIHHEGDDHLYPEEEAEVESFFFLFNDRTFLPSSSRIWRRKLPVVFCHFLICLCPSTNGDGSKVLEKDKSKHARLYLLIINLLRCRFVRFEQLLKMQDVRFEQVFVRFEQVYSLA